MSLANVIPSNVMSALFIEKLNKVLVAGAVCNRNYVGTIANAGDSVKIPSIGEFSVSDHTKNGTLTYAALDSASQVLNINQAKNFSVMVDSIDERQAIANLVPAIVSQGAYQLALASDTYLLQTVMSTGAGVVAGTGLRNLGSSSSPVTVDYDGTSGCSVLAMVNRISKRLNEENVPQEGRWMICPPWFHAQLVQNKVLEVTSNVAGEDAYANGRVGRAFGFDIRVSNNLTNATADASEIFAGTMAAVTFADQLSRIDVRDLETKFGVGVRGLYLYGAKVIQDKALAKAVVTEA